jgi:hypothetical protein
MVILAYLLVVECSRLVVLVYLLFFYMSLCIFYLLDVACRQDILMFRLVVASRQDILEYLIGAAGRLVQWLTYNVSSCGGMQTRHPRTSSSGGWQTGHFSVSF